MENTVKDGCTLNILGLEQEWFALNSVPPVLVDSSFTSIFLLDALVFVLCLEKLGWVQSRTLWCSLSLASVFWRCRRFSLGHHQIPMSGCIWTPWESYITNNYPWLWHNPCLHSERWKNTGVKLSRTSKLDQSISTSMKSKTFGWGWGHSSIPVFSSTCCYWTYWTTAKAKDWKIFARFCKWWVQLYIYNFL